MRPPLLAATLALAVATASLVAAPAATADQPTATSTMSRVATADASVDPDDLDALIAAARVLDTRAEDPDLTFIVGLPRRTEALDAAAQAVATPGKIEYRDVATLKSAARTFGASSGQLRTLRQTAKRAGVVLAVDPSRLIARLTAPASTWRQLYRKNIQVIDPTQELPFRRHFVLDGDVLAGAPAVFADITSGWVADAVEYVPSADIRGIDPAQLEILTSTLAAPGTPVRFPRNTGTPIGDTCGQQALTSRAVFAPSQLHRAYGTSGLARQGMTGADTRLTVISLGNGFLQSDLNAAAACFGFPRPKVDVALGTGVSEPFRNASIEAHLDLITAAATVPKASSIRVVQAVSLPIGFTDAFARALDTDGSGEMAPDVVSISYGICEVEYARTHQALLPVNEDLLRMAALLGISVVAAAGDNGTSMCGAEASLELDAPLVWYPASSPWVTAVGGTRLTLGRNNVRTSEVVWNDLPYTSGPDAQVPGPAGGGGPSAVFTRPWYQLGITPSGPRALPDVALLGAIKPGWPVYYGGSLYTIGGTSGAAPFFAANLALMAAQQRQTGYPPLGLVNPWLYSVAAKDGAPFYDVVAGSNAVQQVGCCAAYAGYDMASGLGAPVMNRLWRSLPMPAG